MGALAWLFGQPPRTLPPSSRSQQPRTQRPGDVSGPLLALGDAFTPTQPKPGRRQVVRRAVELQRILQALQEDRAHVVLYAERGRGKTSLSNLIVEGMRRSGAVVARHTCEAGSTFDTILRGLMQDLPASLLAAPLNTDASEGCEAALPAGELRPRDVVALPTRLACTSLVCMVDEFDRVEDPGTRTRLADTIKQISDRDTPLLFVIVGVSDDLDQILGQHPSIQRNIVGVHLPLFTDAEIAQLITRGGRETGYAFAPAAVARVTVLARGMPYMAQLLGLRLTQAAAARGDTGVSESDFSTAVDRLIGDASARVVALYATLTDYERDTAMVAALRRIATAPQDPWGRLHVAPSGGGAVLVGGRLIAGQDWDRLRAQRVLQPSEAGPETFTFRERPLMHHVLLLAAREAVLPDPPGGTDRTVAREAAEPSLIPGD